MCITERSDGDGIETIAKILPACSSLALVAKSEESSAQYMRKLRRAGFKPKFVVTECEDEKITRVRLDDDVRLIVALGGEAEADCAKRIAYLAKLPVFVAVSSPSAVTVLASQCRLYVGNALILADGAVPIGAAVVRDGIADNSGELPEALGGICSCAVGLFDSEAYLRASGGCCPAEVRDKVFSLIYSALDEAKKGRRNSELAACFADVSLSLARLAQSAGLSFVRGAADDCARVMDMLCRVESRKGRRRGELAFVFGSVLGKIYEEFASMGDVFAPPPDNNRRAELLTEYLGFDEMTAAKAAVSRIKNTDLAAYRMREYRDELCELAFDAVKVFEEAKKPFRRMYEDDGYSLLGAFEPADVRISIALAPDTFSVAGSALALMREFGLLERYLF